MIYWKWKTKFLSKVVLIQDNTHLHVSNVEQQEITGSFFFFFFSNMVYFSDFHFLTLTCFALCKTAGKIWRYRISRKINWIKTGIFLFWRNIQFSWKIGEDHRNPGMMPEYESYEFHMNNRFCGKCKKILHQSNTISTRTNIDIHISFKISISMFLGKIYIIIQWN